MLWNAVVADNHCRWTIIRSSWNVNCPPGELNSYAEEQEDEESDREENCYNIITVSFGDEISFPSWAFVLLTGGYEPLFIN